MFVEKNCSWCQVFAGHMADCSKFADRTIQLTVSHSWKWASWSRVSDFCLVWSRGLYQTRCWSGFGVVIRVIICTKTEQHPLQTVICLLSRYIAFYLADHLTPASEVASRLHLRSANRHQLIVPRCRLITYGRRAFSIAGLTVWNSLPDELTDPARSFDSFRQFLKTILFNLY